jgi:HD-GYP domain-containing protein (c-di-GMP phosphodiesterase class II)
VTAHLVVVSAISGCALAVAVAAAVAAGRSRDGSLVLLALGCLAVGFLMLGHGLTTPGVAGRPPNLWVGRLPVLAIAGFVAGLCAAAWPQRWPALWAGRRPRGILAAGVALLGVVPGAAVLWPAAGGGLQPLPGEAWVRLGLRALIGAVEARDACTHGHSARVAELAVHLGQRLGLRPATLRSLAEGAYLHDVGKVGIPDHVLNKPGPLTDEERSWIEQHPVVGSDIVGRAPSLRDALAVIRPRCLDAFLALMAERGHHPGPGSGDPAETSAAAEACHDQPQAALAATPPQSGRP